MTDHDTDFSDLERLWQEPEPDRPQVSAAQLRRSLWRMRIFLGAELLVCAIGAAIAVWTLTGGAWLLGIATLLFAATGAGLSLWSRLRHLGTGDDALVPHIDNAIAEARGRVRAARAGIIVCCAAQLFAGLIAFDVLLSGKPADRVLMTITVFLIANPAIILYLLRSLEKARQQVAGLIVMKTQDAGQRRAGVR